MLDSAQGRRRAGVLALLIAVLLLVLCGGLAVMIGHWRILLYGSPILMLSCAMGVILLIGKHSDSCTT